MSLAEMNIILEGYARRREQQMKDLYTLASMVAGFVNASFVGNGIPSYDEMFAIQTEDETAIGLYKEEFIDFARAHNKQIRSGNGK